MPKPDKSDHVKMGIGNKKTQNWSFDKGDVRIWLLKSRPCESLVHGGIDLLLLRNVVTIQLIHGQKVKENFHVL